MSKVNKNMFTEAVEAANEPVAEAPVNQTQMSSSFFDIYADNNQVENMTSENAASRYYESDNEYGEQFINNTDSVGVSEFDAEPSEEEMAIINSQEIQPGYYTAMEEQRKGEERLAKMESIDNLSEQYKGSQLAQIVDQYSDDPLMKSISTFLKEPTAANFSGIINQVSAVFNDYFKESSERLAQEKARKEAEAANAAKEGTPAPAKQYDDRGFEINPNAGQSTPAKQYDDRGFEINPNAGKSDTAEYDDRGFKKNKSNQYNGIPAPVEENYTTEDDTSYGYGY